MSVFISIKWQTILGRSFTKRWIQDNQMDSMAQKNSIFKQIISSVIIPEILVFSFILYFSVNSLSKVHDEYQQDEINSILSHVLSLEQLHNKTLKSLEDLGAYRAREIITGLAEDIEQKAIDPKTMNIDSTKNLLGLDSAMEDLYIIDKTGTVVNANSKVDVGLNIYEFSEEYKKFFESIYDTTFFIERFSLESKTKKLKLYAYGPTKDKNYIIELAMYSRQSNEFRENIKKQITSMKNLENIDSIAYYWSYGHSIFSVYHRAKWEVQYSENEVNEGDSLDPELHILKEVFKSKTDTSIIKADKTHLYHYCAPDELSQLKLPSVIKLIYNSDKKDKTVFEETKTSLLIFISGILLLVGILIINVNRITKPILNLEKAAMEISKGNYSIKISSNGSDEVHNLAMAFNNMSEQINLKTQELINEHELVKEKNKEILDSIEYAKRIQTAILPPDRIIKQYLEQSFILYKPKDVVAGDFYWMETIGNIVYYAAADCTGHGVPGAMVSVICVNGLNRSVREFGLREPGKILDKTRELVIKEFEKSEEEVKDGMDISLCALNTETNELMWAGANNPLWIIRKGAEEVEEIKADKQPIGKYAVNEAFKTHRIQLNKGDTIYTFSDGYPDQFGGEAGKKYKIGKFKRLLISLVKSEIQDQKEILDKEFENWRGKIEQIDDVCVIGVRIV